MTQLTSAPSPSTEPGQATIGRLIHLRRVRMGLRQDDLAEASGISQAAISRIERDLGKPALVTLVRLRDALEVDPETFGQWLDTVAKP
jgi:transcriptional regulator with XRE-family HTH domain